MKILIRLVFLVSIVTLPSVGLDARSMAVDEDEKKPKKEITVPEPSTMLLVGAAAAGLLAARTLRGRNGR